MSKKKVATEEPIVKDALAQARREEKLRAQLSKMTLAAERWEKRLFRTANELQKIRKLVRRITKELA